jgi:radical SAM protein with 4Fe4S-binding SPASM domain
MASNRPPNGRLVLGSILFLGWWILDWLKLRLLLARIRNRGLKNWLSASSFNYEQLVRASSPKKLFNFFLVKIEKRLKRDFLHSKPYQYNIEPTNICNLKCPLCPTGMGTQKRPKGKMGFGEFKSIIDQIHPYAYTLELYNWGEPFLNPEIIRMITYAHRRNLVVYLSSNLNYLNERLADQVVAAGLSKILVSVDGATQEIYERYRRMGDLEKVFQNLALLVEARKKAGRRSPFITVRMLINRFNENEIFALRKMTEQLGVDSFTTAPIFINTRDRNQVAEWLPQEERLSYYDYSAPEMTNVWNCSDLWERMVINWDGGIAPCCWVEEPKFDFGNVFSADLGKLWNNDFFVNARRAVSNNLNQADSPKTICHRCRRQPNYLEC